MSCLLSHFQGLHYKPSENGKYRICNIIANCYLYHGLHSELNTRVQTSLLNNDNIRSLNFWNINVDRFQTYRKMAVPFFLLTVLHVSLALPECPDLQSKFFQMESEFVEMKSMFTAMFSKQQDEIGMYILLQMSKLSCIVWELENHYHVHTIILVHIMENSCIAIQIYTILLISCLL